jgi:hypothetical protein
MKVGDVYGNPEKQPGGFAPGFAATVEINTRTGKYEMDGLTGRPMHVDLRFKVNKNKSAGANMEGTWRLVLSETEMHKPGEVYEELAMVNKAIELGLVEQPSPRKWSYAGDMYPTKRKLIERLIEDKEYKAKFSSAMLTVLGAT